MGDDRVGALLVGFGGKSRVDQHRLLEEENGAVILHRTKKRARSRTRDQVKLGQRIGNTEIVIIIAEHVSGGVKGVLGARRLPLADHHADLGRSDLSRDPLEVAHAHE